MKQLKMLILLAVVSLMTTSCGIIPQVGYGYGNGYGSGSKYGYGYDNRYGNRYDNRYGKGNAYGNKYGSGLRKGMTINQVIRLYGQPYDTRTRYNGRNRIDYLYYRETIRSNGRIYYNNLELEFKNSVLHKVRRNDKNASNSSRYGRSNSSRAYRRF